MTATIVTDSPGYSPSDIAEELEIGIISMPALLK